MTPYPISKEIADDLSRGSKKGGADACVLEIPYIKEFLMEYPSGYSMDVFATISYGFGFVSLPYLNNLVDNL